MAKTTPKGKSGGAQGGRPKKTTPSKSPNKPSPKPQGNRANEKPKGKDKRNGPRFTPSADFKANAALGKQYLESSFGPNADAEQKAVLAWYAGLPRPQRMAQYAAIAKTVDNRDLSNWSGDPGKVVLYGDLTTEARAAYSSARVASGNTSGGGPGGTGAVTEFPDPSLSLGLTAGEGSFATGVSGLSEEFIKEAMAGVAPPADESLAGEAGPTKDKKGGKTQRLVKKTTKKTSVRGKDVRAALRSPGVTKSDKKTYRAVSKESPKLSDRLRRTDKKGSSKKK